MKRKTTTKRKRGGKRSKRVSKNIRISLILLSLFIAFFVYYFFSNDHLGSCGNPLKQGIDVSHHQGKIDWPTVAQKNTIKFVYIKASEGATLQDERYAYNTQHAREAGLLVGSYHYFHPQTPIASQFDNFMSVVNPLTQDLIPVIDIEERGGLTNKQICDSLSKFSDMLTLHWGVRPIIYCDQNFYNKILHPRFNNHSLWIARYGALKLKLKPALHNKQHTIWQYSNKGTIEGIKGNVDLNTLHDKIELRDIRLQKQL